MELTRRVAVYEVSTTGARALLVAREGIAGIDVADAVVRGGLTRPGHPPRQVPPVAWGVLAAAVIVLAALALRLFAPLLLRLPPSRPPALPRLPPIMD